MSASSPLTLLDKIWKLHVIRKNEDGTDMLFIDRNMLHEVTSPQAYSGLTQAGRGIRSISQTISFEDHLISTDSDRVGASFSEGQSLINAARDNARSRGILHIDVDHPNQGIVHISAAEQGFVLPGMTVVCGDSHTCTLGALGCLGFGIGTSESEHVMSTQTLNLKKPRSAMIRISGMTKQGVYAKDVILRLCTIIKSGGLSGYAVEFSGEYVRQLGMDGRFTICNMAIEMGARIGLIAPDDTTLSFLKNGEFSPANDDWNKATQHWMSLYSDESAFHEFEYTLDVSQLDPQVTWGISPDQCCSIYECTPSSNCGDNSQALNYVNIEAGQPMLGLPIDVVFIGSCTNGRYEDLAVAASIASGHRVHPSVRALVVPGSKSVKRRAESNGLADIFIAAGFEWREPGCSMCASINQDLVPDGQRSISTSNRNFIGRQGPGSITHLASPATAALAAITGRITSPTDLSLKLP